MDKDHVLNTKEYYEVLKNETQLHAAVWMNLKNVNAKWVKPVTKGKIGYYSTHTNYLR